MSSIIRLTARAVVAGAILLSGHGVQAQTYAYSVFDLGTLGGASLTATALNNQGQVVGYGITSSGSTQAFMTGANGIGLTNLGTLGGASSYAADINDAGQVVGRSERADGLVRAFSTAPSGTGMTDLGTLSGGTTSAATGINNSGQIVGYSTTSTGSGALTRAFSAASAGAPLVNLGSFSYSQPPYASYSGAAAVNDAGVVVGSATEGCNCAGAAFKGQVGSPDIYHVNGVSGNTSGATAVNASGQVVGAANGFTNVPYISGGHAFLSNPDGSILDIGATWVGHSGALAINGLGQVGGYFGLGNEIHGFITGANGLNAVDINSLVAPGGDYYFTRVVGLNDVGQVLALGSNNRSYLLSVGVVPEPSTWALMSLGLGVVGFMASRRRKLA